MDYKPSMASPSSAPAAPGLDSSSCPYTRVTEQGELVRKLKAEKAPKVRGHSYMFACSRFPPSFVPTWLLPDILRENYRGQYLNEGSTQIIFLVMELLKLFDCFSPRFYSQLMS